MEKAFQNSDGWLLFSIGFGDDPSTLTRIIGNGDVLNHAIFELDEINHGLHRLIQNGLVEMVGSTCRCTQEARSLSLSRPKRARGLFADWMDFAHRLQKRPSVCDVQEIIYYTDEEYRNACHSGLRRLMTEQDKKKKRQRGNRN